MPHSRPRDERYMFFLGNKRRLRLGNMVAELASTLRFGGWNSGFLLIANLKGFSGVNESIPRIKDDIYCNSLCA